MANQPLKPSGPGTGRGGNRGGGRPAGSLSKLAHDAREAAKATGDLPHEFLLRVARGERITRWVPHPDPEEAKAGVVVEVEEQYGFDQRVDAAKAAAPYYAPKISTVEVIAGVDSANLDELIARAAAEAGVTLAAGGEGEEGAEPQAPRGRGRVRVE